MSRNAKLICILSALAIFPATALAGNDDVRRAGTCSGNATSRIKLSPQNGRIETEFEVDSNRVGQKWNVVIKDNGVRVFAGSRITTAPSGSFTVNRRIPNRAGVDHIVASAKNPASGETCVGRVSV